MENTPKILAGSHLVLATEDVTRMVGFFRGLFDLAPYFANSEFAEFVLPSRFRIAFFKATGASAKHFRASASREAMGIGVTVSDVEEIYLRVAEGGLGGKASGPPKDHPWGERSFLLIDPDGNRWEVAQSPTSDGMLVNR